MPVLFVVAARRIGLDSVRARVSASIIGLDLVRCERSDGV